MIVSVELKWSGRSADQKSAQEVYTVITTGTKSDDAAKVRDAVGLPTVRQPFPSDPALLCTTRTAKSVGRTLWEVTVDYAKDDASTTGTTTTTTSKDGGSNGWLISYSSASFNDVIDQDIDGKPLINPVGEPLDPHISREFGMTRISCAKDFDPQEWAAYPIWSRDMDDMLYTTNNAVFLSRPPGSVKLVDYAMEPFIGKDEERWTRFRVEFLVRKWNDKKLGPVDWKERRMVQGTRYKTERAASLGGGLIYVTITDDRGMPTAKPVPIDLNGNPIAIDKDPVWKLWKIYGESDFKKLRIDP